MDRQKLYILITIVITLCLLEGCARVETQNAPPPRDPALFAETRSRAETLFSQRQDLAKLREAVELLASLRDPESRNYDVEWNFAKYNYFLGTHTPDEKEAEAAFEKGKQAAGIALRMEPQKPDGYFWYGANLGELSKMSPVTVGFKSVDDIQRAMNKVIELQPEYQSASAYDVLAQVELATSLRGGKAVKAVEYLEQGLAIEQGNANIRLHLAEAYLAVGRRTEAKKQLDHLLQMKPHPEYLAEHNQAVEAAKRLLAKRFD